MSTAVLLVGVALISFVSGAVTVLFWAFPKLESYFVFRPTREISRTPSDLGVPHQEYSTTTRDGIHLTFWHLRPENPRASVVYFHGNSGNLGLFNEVFRFLYQDGFEVFAVDYRGYGKSGGAPTERGLRIDSEETVDFFEHEIRRRNGGPVLYWGRSLGGVFAAWAARHRPPDGLILESCFPSKAQLLEHTPQFRPFRLFSKYRLDTVSYARGHAYPILVLHGDQDRTIPVSLGKSLHNQLENPKQLKIIPGADHVNIHRLNRQQYLETIEALVKQVCVHQSKNT